jgi:hypothetical protein
VQYQVSIPQSVAGSYFDVSVSARGKEWSVQKKISQ